MKFANWEKFKLVDTTISLGFLISQEGIKIILPFVGQLAGAAATLWGARLLARRLEYDRLKDNRSQSFEQFTKAIEQLGSDNVSVRIGAIYSLERVAKDFPEKLHWPVIEVLSALVRNSPEAIEQRRRDNGLEANSEISMKPSLDIKAAFRVICRRDAENDPEDRVLDLRGAVLNHVEVEKGANLTKALLCRVHLQYSILDGANLRDSDLSDAILSHSFFGESDFRNAKLCRVKAEELDIEKSQLQETRFESCQISQLYAMNADFQGAAFTNASLESANFLESV